MKFLRRFFFSGNPSDIQQVASFENHVHLARAYRPVTPKMLPRWRHLGKAITPYHYMQPLLVSAEEVKGQNKVR